jgi:PAS domain S-box-containing protein
MRVAQVIHGPATDTIEATGDEHSLPTTASWLRLLSQGCAVVTFMLACAALVGWKTDVGWLKTVRPGYISMRPLTAVSLIVGSVALGLLHVGGRARPFGRGLGALVLLVGLLTLFEYLLGADLGIDRILFANAVLEEGPYPGRPSSSTAAAFAFLGIALLASRARGSVALRDVSSILVILDVGVAGIGYGYGVSALYLAAPFTGVALHTAAGLSLLSFGLLFEDPQRGLLRILVHDTAGGALARRLIPLSILLPYVLGFALVVLGPRLGGYRVTVGASLLVVAIAVLLAGLTLSTAFVLERADLLRRSATDELRHTNEVVLALTDTALRELPMPEFLRQLCEEVKVLFHGNTARILLADTERRELVVAASAGFEPAIEGGRLPYGQGVASEVFARQEPISIPDLSQFAVVTQFLRADVRSLLGAPLFAPSIGTIGEIDVGTCSPHRFSKADQTLLVLIAERVAQAVMLARAREELRTNEAHLRTERARLGVILAHAAHGIVYVDAKTGVMEANPAADELVGQKLTGLPADEVPGALLNPTGEPVSPQEWPRSRALRGESVACKDLVFLRPDGSRRPLLVSGTPVLNPGGTVEGVVLVYQDISVLKELERLREEFAAIVVHDLRSPVAAILMNAEVLLRAARGKEEISIRTSSIERMRQSAERLREMVNDLLDASRIELSRVTLDRKRITAAEAVQSVIEQVEPTLGDHSLTLTIKSDPGAIFVDRLRFDQVLTNLLENAAKYSEQGMPIDVTVRALGDGVVVAVKDQGVGIAAAEVSRLFDRFYQTHRAREMKRGLGLGLYITKGLVEAHGGRISVESQRNQGSTFYVWLPSSPTAVAPTRIGPEEHPAPPAE